MISFVITVESVIFRAVLAGWSRSEITWSVPAPLCTSRPRYWSKTADVGTLLGLWLAEVTSLCWVVQDIKLQRGILTPTASGFLIQIRQERGSQLIEFPEPNELGRFRFYSTEQWHNEDLWDGSKVWQHSSAVQLHFVSSPVPRLGIWVSLAFVNILRTRHKQWFVFRPYKVWISVVSWCSCMHNT